MKEGRAGTGRLGRRTFVKCILCFTAVVFLFASILFYNYFRERRLAEDSFTSSARLLSIQLCNNLASSMKEVEKSNLSAQDAMLRYAPLLRVIDTEEARTRAYQQLTYQMDEHLSSSRLVSFILVTSGSGFSAFRCASWAQTGHELRHIAEEALQKYDILLSRPNGHVVWTKGNGSYVLLMRRIFDDVRMSFVGTEVIGVRLSVFEDIFSQAVGGKCGEFALLEANGQVLYETALLEKAAIMNDEMLQERKGWRVSVYELPQAGMKLVNFADMRLQIKGYRVMLRRYLLLLFITMIIVSVFFSMTYFKTAHSSVIILRRMDQIAQGQFERTEEKKLPDGDMEMILRCLEDMGERIGHLVERISKEEENLFMSEQALLQMKYDLLRSQVNPHFLYNALATINSMAVLHNEKEIGDMSVRLGKYFRASLMPQSTFCSLHEEIDMLKNYTSLYQNIYQDRLSMTYEVDESCLDCEVPSLLFLPILENALVHGMEEKVGQAHIRFSLISEADMIRAVIEDDGNGISPEKIRQLMDQETSPGGRVGLLNVRRRLELVYKGKASLNIESEQNRYTRVSIVFPANKKSERNQDVHIRNS